MEDRKEKDPIYKGSKSLHALIIQVADEVYREISANPGTFKGPWQYPNPAEAKQLEAELVEREQA